MLEINVTKEFGRGLYATHYIPKDTIIELCEILVLSAQDTKKVNETDLQFYTFVYNADTQQDCLVLGNGEIFNHSDEANVYYYLVPAGNGRDKMCFFAARDIIRGEQLFINYTADFHVDTTKYVGKNLI